MWVYGIIKLIWPTRLRNSICYSRPLLVDHCQSFQNKGSMISYESLQKRDACHGTNLCRKSVYCSSEQTSYVKLHFTMVSIDTSKELWKILKRTVANWFRTPANTSIWVLLVWRITSQFLTGGLVLKEVEVTFTATNIPAATMFTKNKVVDKISIIGQEALSSDKRLGLGSQVNV